MQLGLIGLPLTTFIKGFPFLTSPQYIMLAVLQCIYYSTGTFIPENRMATPFTTIISKLFFMMPVLSIAVLKALLGNDTKWIVTRRKNWGKF